MEERNLKFIKLNDNWNADPVDPRPTIEISGSDVILSIYLNAYQFPQFSEDDIGRLIFYNCLQYTLHPLNDEGFYCFGQSRYKQFGVKWGEFYLVEESDWQESFPEPIVINKEIDPKTSKHYLFYFRDETFECIAESYEFFINPVK